jgi:ATP-dependent RNA helicase DeaD
LAKKRASQPKSDRRDRSRRVTVTTGHVEYIADQWWDDPNSTSRRYQDSASKAAAELGGADDAYGRRRRKKVTADDGGAAPEQEATEGAPKRKKRAKRAARPSETSVEKTGEIKKRPPRRKSTRTAKSDEKVSNEAEVVAADAVADAEQAKPKRKRRRRKSKPAEAKVAPEHRSEEPVVETESAPKVIKKRRRRRKPVEKVEEVQSSEVATAEAPAVESAEKEKPKRRRRKRTVSSEPKAPVEAVPSVEPVASEEQEPKPKRKRRPRRRSKKAESPVTESPVTESPVTESPVTESPVAESPVAELAAETKEEASAPEVKPPRRSRRRSSQTTEKSTEKPIEKPVEKPVEVVAEQRPKRKRRSASDLKKASSSGNFKTEFVKLGLSPEMLQALDAADYLEPTPVQEGVIPVAMKGGDLMGQARTGTGKTAAFAIPILELTDTSQGRHNPAALILVPTRELAVQVRDEFSKLASMSQIEIVAVYGGKPIRQQIEKLRRRPEVVVGTPGRVIDLINRGNLVLSELEIVVLDEADRMLDIGFRPDIEKILRRCPEDRQTLLLTATLPAPVMRLAQRYMREPEILNFSSNEVTVETIEQFYFSVDKECKFDLLVKLIQRENPTQAIVFCRTKRGTEKVFQRLSRKIKLSVGCIHGDLQQSQRDRMMRQFRSGELCILVATDVVGRGIDVSGISHIINFDIPEFCDDYVHRVGRTGRMGREGVAYTMVAPEEGPQLTRIEVRINLLLTRDEIEGFNVSARQEEERPALESKPVYGRSKKRVRRAL